MANDVHRRDGEDLGDIKEFTIDMAAGKLPYAVPSFGGVLTRTPMASTVIVGLAVLLASVAAQEIGRKCKSWRHAATRARTKGLVRAGHRSRRVAAA